MNAANEIKKGWVTWLVTGFISLLVAMTTVYATVSHEDSKDLKKEIDSKATKEELKIGIESAFEYTDKTMMDHKESETILFKNIENIIRLSTEKNEAIIKSIDRRLERIENKTR